jgi:hypothetical protein
MLKIARKRESRLKILDFRLKKDLLSGLSRITTCSLSLRKTVSQFVIPAKSDWDGREPGSRNNLIV